MKLACVSTIRNEIDVVAPFTEHLAALFDHVLLLDHGSADGTENFLAAAQNRPGWTLWKVAVPGFHHALLSTFAMRHLFETTNADCILFLDADEFIDVPSRAALEAALARIPPGRTAGQFAWADCLPRSFDETPLAIGAPIWRRDAKTPFHKVAIPRHFYEATARALRPSTGNHTVEPRDGGTIAYEPIGTILHLPVRSAAQIRQKIVIGTLGIRARRGNPSHEFVHWFKMLARLRHADLTTADLLNIATAYGQHTDWPNLSCDDLPRLGFAPATLDVAHTPLAPSPAPSPSAVWRVLAAAIEDWREESSEEIDLALEGNTLRATAKPLPPAEPRATMLALLETRLAQAQQNASRLQQDIKTIRASTSWRITAPLRAAAARARRRPGPEPTPRPAADITVVLTSCGRHDLLAATLASFRTHNTDARLGDILVVEDGPADPAAICAAHGARLLRTAGRIGQVAAIDLAYAQVDTPFVFHLEDDWEFYRPGCIEPSRRVLEHDPSCIVVSVRAWNDLNDHPLAFTSPDRTFGVFASGLRGIWHGFTWNPGLRRMADYRRVGPYSALVSSPPDVPGQDRGGPEAGIGAVYHRLGYRAVVLDETGYVRHLGWGRTVPWHGPE